MSYDEGRYVDEFLESLGSVDSRKRPSNWPTRHRFDLVFPPAVRPDEPAATKVNASIRLSNLQANFVRRAAVAAGVNPGLWVQRHLLAAAGCLPPRVVISHELLERIYTDHAHIDALLSSVRKQ